MNEERLTEIINRCGDNDDMFSDANLLADEVKRLKHILKGSRNMHSWTLSCLNGVLDQLNEGTDRNVLVKFIETFLKDSGQEGR